MRRALLVLWIASAAFGQDKGSLPLPPSGNVTLPLDEYNRLIEMANKPVKKEEAPPLAYVMQRAEIKLEVKGDAVTGTVLLEGTVLSAVPTKVPLTTGITVLDGQQRGKPLPLLFEGSTHSAILPGPSDFSVNLKVGLPLTMEPGSGSIVFPVPLAGTVHVTLTVPGENTDVHLSTGLATARTSTGGQTTIEAILKPAPQPARLWWATRETAAPPTPREVRFLSDVKTLVSVSEAQLTVVALAEITVVQGELSRFELPVPQGYEVTGVTGASLESNDVENGTLVLKVRGGTLRAHQFLISMEKAISGTKAEVPMISLKGSQRETGEVLVEGEGTMELSAKEAGGLKRMDLRETSPYLRTLARNSLQAAFRYHRQPSETPAVALEWVRFPDSKLLAAVAQAATVTTLVTSEGKSLTEVRLTVRNQAQPFLKLELPAGASILSADVAGEKVKPVQAPDGSRVPLLKPGFHPTGAYTVSFVFLHSGAPFAKKGGAELALPPMDIPIALLNWEVFLPSQYKVRDFGGGALSAGLLPQGIVEAGDQETAEPVLVTTRLDLGHLSPGQLGGVVMDPSGARVSSAQVTVQHLASNSIHRAMSDPTGQWILANIPPGTLRITTAALGFRSLVQTFDYLPSQPPMLNQVLQVGSTTDSVVVSGGALNSINSSTASTVEMSPVNGRKAENSEAEQAKRDAAAAQVPSVNVMNLQQRVAGALPIRVDVPHAGASYRFVRPLVTGEETKLTFTYRTK